MDPPHLAFSKVEDPLGLIPILTDRLPASCFVYNQVKLSEKFTDDLEIFACQLKDHGDTWILTKFNRQDYTLVSISAPEKDIHSEIKTCLETSQILSWGTTFLFNCLQPHVNDLMKDILLNTFGNEVKTTDCPAILFHMEPAVALQLEQSIPADIDMKPLNNTTGARFIADNWKYAKTEILHMVKKSVDRLDSVGIYLKANNKDAEENNKGEKLVCGGILTGYGTVSLLHCDPNYRGRKYGSLVEKSLLQKLAQQGLQPCLVSDVCNEAAVAFHRKLENSGLHEISKVNYILVEPNNNNAM